MRYKSTLCAVIGGVFLLCCKKEAPTKTLGGYTERSYSIASRIPYRYSVYRDDMKSDATTVLYYFHGAGGDEHTWLQANKAIIERWRRQGKAIPIVVAVTFGRMRMVFPESGGGNSGCLEFFMSEAMPRIEGGLGAPVDARYVFGVSMGGEAAAQLVFRYPSFFQKAAIVSPSIYQISPYAGAAAIDRLVESVKSKIPATERIKQFLFLKKDVIDWNIRPFLEAQKSYFADQASWEKAVITRNIVDPPKGAKPKMYISCGDMDEMGFYAGTVELARNASAHSYDVDFHILDGGHMSIDLAKIADFFLSP
jgi:pimeloyl-ACP methyl ester carboxylesterase